MSSKIPLWKRMIFGLTTHDPETAHNLMLRYLELQDYLSHTRPITPPVNVMGISFPGPVGLAAGFNKDGFPIHRALRSQGFGFEEIGTVTPKRQSGNTKPRIKRYVGARVLQNKMGFPNDGEFEVGKRLKKYERMPFPIGVNIGPNKSSVDSLDCACADFRTLVTTFVGTCDYLVVNVSSPNTPGLRALQGEAALTTILKEVHSAARDQASSQKVKVPPVLIKLSPDLCKNDLVTACGVAQDTGAQGVILTNTTMMYDKFSKDPSIRLFGGGLSGCIVFDKMVEMVLLVKAYFPNLTIIAVGGIDSLERVRKVRRCGADLIQVYTPWVYGGSKLIKSLNNSWNTG